MLIASWRKGNNRLIVECRGDDRLKWSLVREAGEDDEYDRSVGATTVARFHDIIAPFNPAIWFEDARH